jgi:ribose 5-phosphate isomerase RpiB
VKTWISTPFEGERHAQRLVKISLIEGRLKKHAI